MAEELDWSVISFRDNQPVIDLISKKPTGLLIMLEEQGMLARKVNNDALLTTYHNTHLGKVDCYAKPRWVGRLLAHHHQLSHTHKAGLLRTASPVKPAPPAVCSPSASVSAAAAV